MSGPKCVEDDILYRPLEYYYEVDNDLKANEVLSVLRNVQGVSFSVKNGKIEAEVTRRGSISAVAGIIEEAKRKVRENNKWMEKDRPHTIVKIETIQKNLESKKIKLIENIKEQILELDNVEKTLNEEYKTRYNEYNLNKEIDVAETTKAKLNDEITRIENDHKQATKSLEDIKKSINNCTSCAQYLDILDKNDLTKFGVNTNLDSSEVANNLLKRASTLRAFVTTFNKAVEVLEKEGLQTFLDRFQKYSEVADPFANDSVEKINGILQDIKNQIEIFEIERKMEKRSAENQKEIKDKIRSLIAISDSFKPLLPAIENLNADNLVLVEKNIELIKKLDSSIKNIEKFRYISPSIANNLKRIKEEYKQHKAKLLSESTSSILNSLISQLENMTKIAEKDDDAYFRYTCAANRYKALHAQLTSDDTENQSRVPFINPTNFSKIQGAMVERMINELIERGNRIEKEIKRINKQGVALELADAVDGKIVFKEVDEKNQLTRIAFVRNQNKGVIYEITIDKEAQMIIYPRGVILADGSSPTSVEEHQKAMSSCGWSEELIKKASTHQISRLKMREVGEETTKAMLDKKEYMKLDAVQTRAYLELVGTNDEEEEYYESETRENVVAAANSKEIRK